MYLKSLELKGFKSFADRSVLSLEPGITAIVGPNGSGKSNISDAVLWVLGERSARNLRGQAMEDIIFSGSAARKAVSVAEVTLVLDNSDHVLPVDFDEVAIARRMYRSGESEYLVNGVVARRLDVLDILHDSGLGTGTHSIISQGSLDSILQSKPEDRRALIEEAAGILKHKRRKEKSARKLQQMENNLARVRDVTAEVARQLGPLERKAKRAEAHAQATAELSELRLALAVDDLRKLQREWQEVLESERAASQEVDSRRAEVDAAERTVNEYQERMRRETEDAGVIARRQRRASNLAERMDGTEMLLRERRRAAQESQVELNAALDGAAARKSDARRELEAVQAQLAEVSQASAQADAEVAQVSAERKQASEERRRIEDAIGKLSRQIGQAERELDSAQRKLSSLKESLASGVTQVKLVEARKGELEVELSRAQADHKASAAALEQARAQLDALAQREAEARDALVARFEARDAAHARRDQAHQDVRLAQAEHGAIQKSLAAARSDDPALEWLLGNAERFGGGLVAVSKSFRVSRGLEELVERLLGDELAALAADDPDCALGIARALADGGLAGDVLVVMKSDAAAARSGRAYAGAAGHALLGELTYAPDMAPVLEALLGDVVVCDTRDDAFAGHAQDPSWRYVSEDGCVVWPSGKVRIWGASEGASEGVIARERRLGELSARIAELEADQAAAEEAAQAADAAYRELQSESLALSQQLANAKGAFESAQAEEQRVARRVQGAARDIEQADRQMEAANRKVDDIQPSIDELSARIAELEELRRSCVAERHDRNDEVAPLRRKGAQLDEQYSEARLEAATLSERKTYVERLVVARKRDIEQVDASSQRAREQIGVKGVAVRRADEALAVFERISLSLGRRLRALDDAVSASEASTNDVHAGAAAARDTARLAHDAYDSASSRMSQVRIQKSRLEMRVEAAVGVIVDDLGTPLEHAQELPQLEDRTLAEDQSQRLERRIKNMGAINPDAAEEYAKLKERYDYLSGQLSDMESARKSLGRIVRVIDERMKDDFIATYEQVNANFGEIFQELFPGGSAHLSFDDPDDVENTGIEVTAQPRGKRLTKMMLMSGGEKSLTALALLFAVYKTRATPFYILDEVEAALDDTNLRRLAAYIDSLRDSTQLIMITHQRRTMEMADVLFGVSMHADGVTKVISQKLERALEHAE